MDNFFRIFIFFGCLFLSNYSASELAQKHLKGTINNSEDILIGSVVEVNESDKILIWDERDYPIHYAIVKVKCTIKGELKEGVNIKIEYISSKYTSIGKHFNVNEKVFLFLTNKSTENYKLDEGTYLANTKATINDSEEVGYFSNIIELESYLPLEELLKIISIYSL